MAVRQRFAQRVSIVGWGSVSPLGADAVSTWEGVLAGRSGIGALTAAWSEDFRLPVLLRQYFNLMEAKVCDLSLARDFNQITEILMAADLSRLPKDRLAFFIDVDHQPVYQQFSWYRGKG